jgi:hypothetical protein
MPIHEQYTREILNQLNYVATWLPTVRLEPGDICYLRGHQISHESHLDEFDIHFELSDRPVETSIEYASAGAVSTHVKLSGDPPPMGSVLQVDEAGISLSFARSEAVILRLADCSARRIKSPRQVGEQVLALHQGGNWPEGYAVVTETVLAGASTIIISNGNDAAIDLVAQGSVGQGLLTLASIDAGLQVKRESKIGAKFISMPGLTPLVRVSGIKKRFLRPDVFKSGQQPDEFSFSSVHYSDYSDPS